MFGDYNLTLHYVAQIVAVTWNITAHADQSKSNNLENNQSKHSNEEKRSLFYTFCINQKTIIKFMLKNYSLTLKYRNIFPQTY